MTITQLREIAAGIQHEAVQGHTQMNKEHLLASLCNVLNIDMHVHHHAAAATAGSINKIEIKQRIKHLKEDRTGALKTHDSDQLHDLRHQIHELKRSLRKAADTK